MQQTIIEKIKQADIVLIGIGEDLDQDSAKLILTDQEDMEEELVPYYKSDFYSELKEETPVLKFYNKLASLIKGKPYFVVTMCTDGEIYRSDLNPEQIVAPCGDIRKLQCEEHIVDALEINKKVLETKDTKLAVCPKCHKPLSFHTIKSKDYLEEGYLPQWEKYTRWLSHSLNMKLCVLEFGVGFQYPQVIRWPFEKTVFYNKKACLIRVNESLCQLPEELADKGIGIKMSPLDFMEV